MTEPTPADKPTDDLPAAAEPTETLDAALASAAATTTEVAPRPPVPLPPDDEPSED